MIDLVKSITKKFIKLTALLLSLWLITFISYMSLVQKTYNKTNLTQAEAIIILTGDINRIKDGVTLFDEKNIPHLYISGANKSFTRKNIPSTRSCCITIGYQATNTQGNVEEVRQWLLKKDLKNIVLITSDYHMPRALHMFKTSLPTTIKIQPYPSHYNSLRKRLTSLRYIKVVFLEFHKYALYRFLGIKA